MTSPPPAETFRAFTRAVFATQAALLKHGDLANAAFGQSSARWRVLHEAAEGGATPADIARTTGYSRQAVQRLADVLVAEGLATYTRDAADRRRQTMALTPPGRQLLAEMEAHFGDWSARLLGQLAGADLPAVTDGLEKIRAVLLADMVAMQDPAGDDDHVEGVRP